MRVRTGLRFLGALAGLLLSLWAVPLVAAEPGWEQAATMLRAAALPAGQAEALLGQAEARRLPPAQVAAWAENMTRLHQAGVPAGLMAERILQGLVKGVPAARLDQALAVLQENLLWARQVVDRHVAKAEIRKQPAQLEEACRNLEAALRAGVARARLEQIFGKNPLALEQLATLARAAADLRSFGVETDAVTRVLAQAANAGMGARELAALEGRFAAGMAEGHAASSLFAEFERGVRDFRPRGTDTLDKEKFQRELREELQRDRMREEFKGPAGPDIRPGPAGGGPPGGAGGYPGGGGYNPGGYPGY